MRAKELKRSLGLPYSSSFSGLDESKKNEKGKTNQQKNSNQHKTKQERTLSLLTDE
jgi:hypothetical protein